MDIQKKLNSIFLIVFALLMGLGAHYFQHNQGGSGLELAQNNVVWVFFSALIGLGLWKITEAKKIFYSRFTLVFLIAFLLFLIPLFYSNNILAEQSYTRLIGLFAGFLLFVSLQQMRFSATFIQRLLLLIVLAGFLQACYSLMQDYLLPADNIFGYNIGYGRPYGIFQQPNVLASFMATTLILAGYLLQKIDCKRTQIFLLMTVLLNMWVITVTVSRTGYLGVIIALLLLSPWSYEQHKKRFAIFVLTLLVAIGLASLKGDDFLAKRNIDNIKEGGVRVEMYSHSWEMIQEEPLLGYGYGSFEKSYLITHAQRVKNGELPASGLHLTHPHNDTLFWAVEGGVVPLFAILFLVVNFLLLLKAFKLSHALALMALVIPIALHTQTEYPLYHSALHWLVLIVLVFYIDNESEKIEQQQFRPTFALRVFALLIPLFCTIFMLSNLYTISKITEYERSKNPDIKLLLDIVNPLVFQDRFDFHLSYFRLSIAVQNNNQQEIQAVVDWTEQAIEKTPKSFFYIILYIAYKHNNQLAEAQQLLEYARYLYPKDKQLANIDKPAISQTEKTTSKTQSSAQAMD
ncbi:PglL family O-oligosaccharyltransferase [Psychromonas sp. Urea-02u-13]|uniref:PglL family O-oligosaccharyltransferase n=1 Tax=Psychromonas sp. Urea-02u-13 TaxID=2058326 RepID=UPI000C31F2F1|nr:PglL family O-oligosaccharyltransferase [Psychromonas sp. Urea-02u-13]PKG38225.1 O-antigen polymerase [Psychromonas sp. Urea-02u-13]